MNREIEMAWDAGLQEVDVGESALEPTFRDPAGHLYLTETHALRRVLPAAVEETLAFLGSPLRASLASARSAWWFRWKRMAWLRTKFPCC